MILPPLGYPPPAQDLQTTFNQDERQYLIKRSLPSANDLLPVSPGGLASVEASVEVPASCCGPGAADCGSEQVLCWVGGEASTEDGSLSPDWPAELSASGVLSSRSNSARLKESFVIMTSRRRRSQRRLRANQVENGCSSIVRRFRVICSKHRRTNFNNTRYLPVKRFPTHLFPLFLSPLVPLAARPPQLLPWRFLRPPA